MSQKVWITFYGKNGKLARAKAAEAHKAESDKAGMPKGSIRYANVMTAVNEVIKHFDNDMAATVRINGRLCFTRNQAERRLQEIP